MRLGTEPLTSALEAIAESLPMATAGVIAVGKI